MFLALRKIPDLIERNYEFTLPNLFLNMCFALALRLQYCGALVTSCLIKDHRTYFRGSQSHGALDVQDGGM